MCLLVLSLCLWGCGEKPGDSPDSSDPQTTADSEGRVSVTDRIRESVQAERESARAARESAEAEQESAEAAKESSAAVRESSAAVCESSAAGESSAAVRESSAAGESSAAARESSAASQESLAEPIVLTASPDVDDIAGLGELRAGVEEPYYTDWAAFEVDMENGHNPYDVEWDYGELYDVYIEKSDWSLVFDADFYEEAFPALAFLYHYDEKLLLEHFQTVGICRDSKQRRMSGSSLFPSMIGGYLYEAIFF